MSVTLTDTVTVYIKVSVDSDSIDTLADTDVLGLSVLTSHVSINVVIDQAGGAVAE